MQPICRQHTDEDRHEKLEKNCSSNYLYQICSAQIEGPFAVSRSVL